MSEKKLISESVKLANEHLGYLHTIPERAFEEKHTTAYLRKMILSALRQIGILKA